MAQKDPTPEEVAAAQAVIDRNNAAMAKDRAERLKPLADLIATDAFKEIVRVSNDLAPRIGDIREAYDHVVALGQVAHRLEQIVPTLTAATDA